MTYIFWATQILLALGFLTAGATHAFRYEQATRQMPWTAATPKPLVRTIGLVELLGAIGMILPAVTGVLPWLTPLAAVGLGLIMALAIPFHLGRNELRNAATNGVLLALAVFVALGRYLIVPL